MNSDFHRRFKGKIGTMDKKGITGMINKVKNPIQKDYTYGDGSANNFQNRDSPNYQQHKSYNYQTQVNDEYQYQTGLHNNNRRMVENPSEIIANKGYNDHKMKKMSPRKRNKRNNSALLNAEKNILSQTPSQRQPNKRSKTQVAKYQDRRLYQGHHKYPNSHPVTPQIYDDRVYLGRGKLNLDYQYNQEQNDRQMQYQMMMRNSMNNGQYSQANPLMQVKNRYPLNHLSQDVVFPDSPANHDRRFFNRGGQFNETDNIQNNLNLMSTDNSYHTKKKNIQNKTTGGYNRRNKYTPYTVNQYKRLHQTTNYKLGGLGANYSEEWRKKISKADRAKEYAKLVNKINSKQIENKKTSFTKKRSGEKVISVRQKALEFAKTIKRPKKRKSMVNRRGVNQRDGFIDSEINMVEDDLMKLEREHQSFKSKINLMKRA